MFFRSNTVFHVDVSGTNVGDVEMGEYSANKEGILWDKSEGTLKVRQREVKLSAHFEDMTDLDSDVTQNNFEATCTFGGGATNQGGIVTNAALADATKDFILEFDAKLVTLGSTEGFFWGIKSSSLTTAGVNYPGVGGDAHNLTEDHAGFILAEITGVNKP